MAIRLPFTWGKISWTLGGLLAACGMLILFLGSGAPPPPDARVNGFSFAQFAQELEDLRDEQSIPGMSAAIAREGEILWSRGFGWADRENKIPATEESIYHLASLTKPFAATVLLQLVQEGKLNLDAPVSDYGVNMEQEATVRVWHLLSHTSSGKAGSRFKYDGSAFAELEKVIEGVTNQSFAEELTDRIIQPLQLTYTAPNPRDSVSFSSAGMDSGIIEQQLVTEYARAWGRLVWPSGLFGPLWPIEQPAYFGTAAGLVSSARDVAKFSIALDQGVLLNDSIRHVSMSPVKDLSGNSLPYGLGWFVQEYKGHKLVWHYGHWFGSSSLIVKVPEKELTFVVLANSDGLSRFTGLGTKADICASSAAIVFLEYFLEP